MYSRYKSFNKCIIKFFSSYFYRLSSLSWCHPWKDKSFEFWCSVISFFSSLLVLLLSYLRNHCLIQEPRVFTLVFSPEGFIGLVLTYESFIHFELFFYAVWCQDHTSFCTCCPSVPASFLEVTDLWICLHVLKADSLFCSKSLLADSCLFVVNNPLLFWDLVSLSI